MNNFRIPDRKLFRTYFTNDFRYTDDFPGQLSIRTCDIN